MRIRWRAVAGLVSLVAFAAVVPVSLAFATPSPDHKVTICHATASVQNPYVVITVDVASSGGQQKLFGPQGHAHHTGPVFDPETNENGDNWGDVIPAFDDPDGDGPFQGFGGLNVGALGSNCAVATPTTPPPTENHDFTLDADSHCDFHTGHVVITATFVNDGSESASVTATDVTFSGTTAGPVTIAAGAAHTFTIDTGLLGPQPGGVVRFDIEWANGDTDSATAKHSPTNGCGPTPTPTTPPPTPTTPPPTSPPPTSPPPTTPPTTTPPTPTHTRTHPPKCIAHPARPACNTKTPPTGIAFTGSDSAPLWVSLVIALLLLGTGAMWAGSKMKERA